jgi:hypothetical protein
VRATILGVLERIADPRILPEAERCTEDADPAVAAAAVSALRPLLGSDDRAVATRALERVTLLLLDGHRPAPVRLAALEAIGELPPDVVGPLRARAARDGLLAESGPATGSSARTDDRAGERAADRSPARDRHDEPRAPDAPGIEAGPDAVAGWAAQGGAAAPFSALHHLVVETRRRESEAADEAAREGWRAARGALHQALALRGSRVALYDLRETLEATRARLPVAMVSAIATIGDRSTLDAVADAAARTNDPWTREHLTRVLREIVQREKLTKRSPLLKRIEKKHPGLL